MQKETFNVTGMTCSACSARVERAVKKMEGTAAVSVNLLTNTMTLAYDAAVTSPAAIIAVVEDAGYGASVKGALAAQGTAERGAAEVPTGTDAAEKE
ncbi:MAG: heavy-metal-associated domain-containing protein, partial [Centipeda sp. (in: firmicutes)]